MDAGQGLQTSITHGRTIACYAPGPDHMWMPPLETFRDTENYYATLAHKCCHWTKHPTRLDRELATVGRSMLVLLRVGLAFALDRHTRVAKYATRRGLILAAPQCRS
jgi:hypothetical protein